MKLYRICGNPNCDNVEKEDNIFKCCSKCRLVSYCSKECQTKHWKLVHRKECINIESLESINPINEMPPEESKTFCDNGSYIFINGLPIGSEIGIDYYSWDLSGEFFGFKMVPPGVHLLYWK